MSNQETKEKPPLSLKITRELRESGFLAIHSPYEFQTLITLCTFADEKGRLKVSGKSLAQALNLSEKQAQYRLKKLCQKRWQGKPLLVKENSNAKFTPNGYRLLLPEGLMLIQESNFRADDFQRKPMCSEAESQKGSPLPEAEVGYNNVVVVNNIYNKTTNNKQRLVESLKAEGVTEEIAIELVEKYPEEQITAQLNLLPYRKAKNPAGMLIKAIKENWAPPQTYQGMKELEAQKAIKQSEDERIAKEEARRRNRQKQIEAIKAKMTKEELQGLRERAKQKIPEVLKDAYRAKKLPLPEILIESQMNYIIGTEYLKK